jgi:Ser/Thr protein kinase RdoA (MazF antagonist)
MSFREHLRRTARAAVTSALALGVLLAAIGLASDGIQFHAESGRTDSAWLVLILPVAWLLLSALLSPLSFLLDRLMFRRRH